MSRVLERPILTGPTPSERALAARHAAERNTRPAHPVRRFVDVHRRSLAWLGSVLLIAGLVQGVGMAGSPQRIDDEGTYTAQAWSVLKLGELAHYTYWYDHPPLGWLQLAAYGQLTFAFERYDIAVIAMREAMLVAMVIATALIWLLARRIGLSRLAASFGALAFAVSPLAVQFHRTVYLDNVAVPWLIGAFLLALTRKGQLLGFAGSALAFGIAVLTKETFLLALPVLAWVMWRNSNPATRRYTLSVAAMVLTVVGTTYLLLAAVKGELLPGPDRVSLATGVAFQLATRESSGSAFEAGSLLNQTLTQWFQLDPVILVAGAVAGVAGLFSRRVRPFAVLYLAFLVVVFRPGGYTPVPFVIQLLPFAALLLAWAAEAAVRRVRRRGATRALGFAGAAVGIIGAIVAGPIWFTQLRGLWLADLDAPLRQAQVWAEQNIDRADRVVVDDAMWVDLVQAGFPRENVVWYYKVDTDSDVRAQLPNGWRDIDWVITTDSMRTFPDGFPQVSQALDNSTVVASFGSGDQQVDVRRVAPEGQEAAAEAADAAAGTRLSLGSQLLANPRLSFTGDGADALRGGTVDPDLIVALGRILASHELSVSTFPVVDGEDGTLRRQVVIDTVDGVPATGAVGDALADEFARLGVGYEPRSSSTNDDGLTLLYPLD
ncbi:ArnT family glycosyltransferase [uncultured Microbacterium sp.]|uniref:ArnT family glycosyltransferase n=1 Tax=uncultured Microbacterium sp. TaxID=191216 RepID=UPI003748A483